MSRLRSLSLLISLLVVLSSLVVAGPVGAQPARQRSQVELTDGWKFHKGPLPGAERPELDDSRWADVTVPHTWNGKDGQDGGDDYYRGIGWYRRAITVPAAEGKRMWLEFEGANSHTVVWVNGQRLGEHVGGYARFRFDATEALRPGIENVVAVRVSNAPDPNVAPLDADYTFYGGLYRNVRLVTTDELHVDMLDFGGPGVYFRQRELSPELAVVDATAKVSNDSPEPRRVRVRALVTGEDGAVVADTSSDVVTIASGGRRTLAVPIEITSPRLWNGLTDPFSYRAKLQVIDASSRQVTDAVTEPLGLRSFAVDAKRGFLLNGKPLRLHGVNRHQDRPGKGWAVDQSDHVEDFRLMREMGVNALRTAHYQQSETVYDLADRNGFVVWTEVPLVNEITDTPAFRSNIEQQMRELIRQNYNHPSVVFWGVGNELRRFTPEYNALVRHLAEVVKQEDPGRLSTYANWGEDDNGPLTRHTEEIGHNEYFGWYEGKSADLAEWADDLHAVAPQRPFALSEYGAGASIHQHAENPVKPVPDGPWHPEEYQAQLHETSWQIIQRRPWIWGAFVWNMFDFAVDYRDEGDTPGRNDKGLVTYDRKTRKDAFYWYQANWTQTPVLHLTSKRWKTRTEPVTDIKVYTNTDSVTLWLNGQQVGAQRSSEDRSVVWPQVELRPGRNVVQVKATKDGRQYTDSVVWTVLAPR